MSGPLRNWASYLEKGGGGERHSYTSYSNLQIRHNTRGERSNKTVESIFYRLPGHGGEKKTVQSSRACYKSQKSVRDTLIGSILDENLETASLT